MDDRLARDERMPQDVHSSLSSGVEGGSSRQCSGEGRQPAFPPLPRAAGGVCIQPTLREVQYILQASASMQGMQ